MNHLDLTGRHAIVTGGAKGIGYATAERLLASEDCSFCAGAVFDLSGGRAVH